MRTNEQTAADAIMSSINQMSLRPEDVAACLANDHPTLQQSFARLAFAFISEMAEKDYTDARNEASVEMCKLIHEAILGDDQIYRGLPFT